MTKEQELRDAFVAGAKYLGDSARVEATKLYPMISREAVFRFSGPWMDPAEYRVREGLVERRQAPYNGGQWYVTGAVKEYEKLAELVRQLEAEVE